MDIWPDFILELSYDEVTYHEVLERVALEFPRNWRVYHGVEKSDSMLVGDRDARQLMSVAHRLLNAAAVLSRRKLPEETRVFAENLKGRAAEERRSREAVRGVLARLGEEMGPEHQDSLQELMRRFADLGPAEDEYRVFRTFLEIDAFARFGHLPGELADRTVQLLEFLVKTESPAAHRYLERVARCFVLGLGAELAVMSRSVLESALHSLDLESLVDRRRAAQGGGHSSLVDWIEAATSAGLLDERANKAAHFVRQAGNDAVHAAAGVEAAPEEILSSLVLVFEAMDRGE